MSWLVLYKKLVNKQIKICCEFENCPQVYNLIPLLSLFPTDMKTKIWFEKYGCILHPLFAYVGRLLLMKIRYCLLHSSIDINLVSIARTTSDRQPPQRFEYLFHKILKISNRRHYWRGEIERRVEMKKKKDIRVDKAS